MDYKINFSKIKNLANARAKKYPQGAVVAGEGIDAELYIILKGELGIYAKFQKQDQTLIKKVGAGDFYGESALFSAKSQTSAAVALTDVFALHIDRDTAVQLIKEEPEFAFELMKAFSARLDKVPDYKMNDQTLAEQKPTEPATGSVLSPFPEGHGSYQLAIHDDNPEYLTDHGHTCPLCKQKFTARKVRTVNLVLDSTDASMRNRYKGIEPLYYDVVTCPGCLYSALTEMFASPDISNSNLLRELRLFNLAGQILTGSAMDTFSVFAGYYLALLCAPRCFRKHEFATAKLLLKLSRIYEDCADSVMEQKTSKDALDAYMILYLNLNLSAKENQQVCIVIGELSLKLKDLKTAKSFLFKAKTEREGSPSLKRQAEDRLMEIRDSEKAEVKQ